MNRRFIILLCAVILCACNYNKFEDIDSSGTLPWTPNSSLQSVTEFYSPMVSDFIVEGTVVSSDSSSNFFREVIITDQRAALRLTFNFYDIYSIYHLGDVVAVNLKGLVVGREDGILTAGFATEDTTRVGEIPTLGIAQKIINYQGVNKRVEPKKVKIDEITEKLLGNVVTLENCYFSSNLGTFGGEQKILQENCDSTIMLHTSPFCTFASEPIPSGIGSIEAIVIKNGERLALKINDEKAIFDNNLY